KLETEFWRACRADVSLGRAEALLEAFRRGAPLSARPDRELLEASLAHAPFFGLQGFDNLLLGQGIERRLLEPRGDRARFDRWIRHGLPVMLDRALPQAEALEAYVHWLAERR
ncbi:MAG: hypothetical protein OEY14_12040, partial [Myxococcales bacterium]|nr:hypothetical protein [Myxococcales bacterium]